MNKTKEEILEKHTGETGIYLTKGMVRGSDALEAMDEYTTHLTDQIKSMEGQVKELREERDKFKNGVERFHDKNMSLRSRIKEMEEETFSACPYYGKYTDAQSQLESLQKENERLYDALSNIMNNERWLEMNIDTVNNLLSKHA